MCLPVAAALSSSEVSGAAFKLYACYCAHRGDGFEVLIKSEQIHAETGIGIAYISTLKFELLEAGWIGLSNKTAKGVVPLKGFEVPAEHIRTERKLSKIERTSDKEASKIERKEEKVSNNESSAEPPEKLSKIERILSDEVSKNEGNSAATFENRKEITGTEVAPYSDIRTSTDSSSATLQNSVGLSADVPTVEERAKALRKAIAELPKHKRCARPTDEEWAQMLDIFGEWRRAMEKNGNAKLTPERGRALLDRLRSPVGFTREDFSAAIRGCRASPHHMGQNDRGEVYNDLELICRTDQKLEEFIGKSSREKVENGAQQNGIVRGNFNRPNVSARTERQDRNAANIFHHAASKLASARGVRGGGEPVDS